MKRWIGGRFVLHQRHEGHVFDGGVGQTGFDPGPGAVGQGPSGRARKPALPRWERGASARESVRAWVSQRGPLSMSCCCDSESRGPREGSESRGACYFSARTSNSSSRAWPSSPEGARSRPPSRSARRTWTRSSHSSTRVSSYRARRDSARASGCCRRSASSRASSSSSEPTPWRAPDGTRSISRRSSSWWGPT